MSRAKGIIQLALVLVLVQSASAQNDKAKQIDDLVSGFSKADQFYGQVLVSENGKIIYEKAFGLANADYNIPNQLDTRIGIASITKYFTVVILSHLVVDGKLALTDKLNRFIPDFPSGEKITIAMLKDHRSGIPHRVMPSEAESVAYSSAEFIEKVKLAKLEFEPGSKQLYSSAGYSTLARVLELVSGKPYAQLLQEYVFTPAGMRDSVTFDGELVMARRAQDYYPSPYGLINVPLKNYSFLIGAGSVFGTAHDLYKFTEAVLDGKYGTGVQGDIVGKMVFKGSGSTNGHSSYFEIDREKKYGLIMVSNLSGGFDIVAKGIMQILQGKDVTVSSFAIPTIVPNPNKDMSEFLGRYKRDDGSETTIVLRNDHLFSGDIKLYPTKPDCFFEYRFFGNVCFVRGDGGKIKGIDWKGAIFGLSWVRL